MDLPSAHLAFIDGLGTPEMLMIFVIILLLFGGQKLPEFARGIGKSLREFKKAAAGVEDEFKRALDDDERKQNQLKLAESSPASTPSPDANAGPGTPPDPYHDPHHEQHYGDYSHEKDAPATSPEPPATTPAAPVAAQENKILAPAAPTPPAARVLQDYDDGPAPAPVTEPAKNPPPAGDQPKNP